MTALSLSVNLTDPTGVFAPDGAYLRAAQIFLDLCATQKAQATFFTAGKMALAAPWLVKKIAEQGHEIAYLGRKNIALCDDHPEIFQREAYVDKDRLEQLAAHQLIGYRAPLFSLDKASLWAIEKCGKLGFRYSSSVLPAHTGLFKIPEAPHSPFLWANGMIEIPLSVASWGGVTVPFLNGICLSLLPFAATQTKIGTCVARDPRFLPLLSVDLANFGGHDKMQRENGGCLRAALGLALRGKSRAKIERFFTSFELTEPLGVLVSDKNFKKGLGKF